MAVVVVVEAVAGLSRLIGQLSMPIDQKLSLPSGQVSTYVHEVVRIHISILSRIFYLEGSWLRLDGKRQCAFSCTKHKRLRFHLHTKNSSKCCMLTCIYVYPEGGISRKIKFRDKAKWLSSKMALQ